MSTRGNAESVVALLLLGSVIAILRSRPARSGAFLAAAIHLKLYPLIYTPAFLYAMSEDFAPFARATFATSSGRKRSLDAAQLRFLAALAAVYAALTAGCYLWCGFRYVDQAILHHLIRADARHNFSPYFLSLYLSPPGSELRRAISLLAFAPQVLILLVFAVRFGKDLPFCMLMQTLVFVGFNKVCTAQYFIWYHVLLPLVLPSTDAFVAEHHYRAAAHAVAWTLSLLAWLGCAHQLEFRAKNLFVPLWLASLAFLGANVALIRLAIELHRPTPLFRAGRLARQCCLYGAGVSEV